ncbi:MAG: hypothetical protein U9R37_01355 [Campylobacterota bacterium]|nr:hypothetical protein [Campylobacterota bacterium]
MKKELIIFVGLFLFLAIGMHFKEWMSHPVEHIMALPHASSYGLGWEHPIVYTLLLYIIVGIPRVIAKLFSKKSEKLD